MSTNKLKEGIRNRIMELMQVKGLNSNSMARLCGVSPNTFYSVLNGKNSAGTTTLERIIMAFPDVSPEWLQSGEGKMLIDGNINQPSPNQTLKQKIEQLETEIQLLKNENQYLKESLDREKANVLITQENLKMAMQMLQEKGGRDTGENKSAGGGKVSRAV